MFYIINFFFIFNIKNFFLKLYLKVFIFYFFDFLNFGFINKSWFNIHLHKKFSILSYWCKKNIFFLVFNIFSNYFFFSFFNLIADFYNISCKRYYFGYLNIYQIFNIFYNYKFFFICNKLINLKKKYIYI
ncbi:MAG: hypothetical protein ACSHUF_00320 [Candidatus Nasuia deltocephalinicola]